MMRRKLAKDKPLDRKLANGPLAEGIRKRRPAGFFDSMADAQLVEYASRTINRGCIKSKSELKRRDSSLIQVLRRRKLIGKIAFEGGMGDWHSLSDAELVALGQRSADRSGAVSRYDLSQKDRKLYSALQRRGLLDRIRFERMKKQTIGWKRMDDGRIIEMAREAIKQDGITTKNRLQVVHPKLYDALLRRGLLEMVGLRNRFERRDWAAMGDDELVVHARRFIKREGISKRKQLEEADRKLYGVLRRRGLLDATGLPSRPSREPRSWDGMSQSALMGVAQRFIDDNRIPNVRALALADSGLYAVLRARGILAKVRLHGRRRSWKDLDDVALLAHAKGFISEEGITSKSGLKKADNGLYIILRTRKLLGRLGIERVQRDWASMSDAELVSLARRLIKERGVSDRGGLMALDRGLYRTVKSRGLIDTIFSHLDRLEERRAVKDVVDAVEGFG